MASIPSSFGRSEREEPESGTTTPTSSARSSTFSPSEPAGSDFSNFEEVQLDVDDGYKTGLDRGTGRPAQNSQPKTTFTTKELERRSQEKGSLYRKRSPTNLGQKHAEPNTSVITTIPKVSLRKSHTAPLQARPTIGQDHSFSSRETSRSPSAHSLKVSRLSPDMARRTSFGPKPPDAWTKNRKTAKEIEAEYRDSDDDLPDDASLYNVPMSPSLYRNASHASFSLPRSTSCSPERSNHLGSQKTGSRMTPPAPKQITRLTKGPRPSLGPRMKSLSTPTSPISSTIPRPTLRHGLTTSNINSDTKLRSLSYSKSLSNVLGELDDETADLTLALDNHARLSDANLSFASKTTSPSRTPKLSRQFSAQVLSIAKSPSSEASIIVDTNLDEPRFQRAKSMPIANSYYSTAGDLLESLPFSKEKEAVMSRTRPPWLPPKNRKEDLKHMKDHTRMMALAMQAESSRRRSLKSEALQRERLQAELFETWSKDILPHLPQDLRHRRTRELVWKGIPSDCRPEAWLHAIGNDLNISRKTYEAALARAAKLGLDSSDAQDRHKDRQKLWRRAIERDVNSTLPMLNLFQDGQTLHLPLKRLLEAYATYRSDAGYVHGTNMIGAIILLVIKPDFRRASITSNNEAAGDPSHIQEGEVLAFECLANLMNRRLLGAFMLGDEVAMAKTFSMIDELFKAKFDQLWKHLFQSQDLDPRFNTSQLFEPMIRYLFTNTTITHLADSNGSCSEVSSGRSVSHSTRPSGLSLPLLLRLWDLFLFDGDAAIIRVCVGLIGALEMRLYGDLQDVLGILGWGGNLGSLGWKRSDPDSDTTQGPGSPYNVSSAQNAGWEVDEAQIERVMKLVRSVGKAD